MASRKPDAEVQGKIDKLWVGSLILVLLSREPERVRGLAQTGHFGTRLAIEENATCEAAVPIAPPNTPPDFP